MIELKAQVFGVAIESPFTEARPFSKDWLDKTAIGVLNAFKDYGLRPENVVLRNTDVLFGYELNFALFGGSATFALSGVRLLLNFQNVTSRSALQTVSETAIRAHAVFEGRLFSEHMIRVIAHMPPRDEADKIDTLMADSDKQVEFVGRLLHMRVDEWEDSIRLEIDRSLLVQNAIFISWFSKYRGKLTSDTLARAGNAFQNAARRLGFNFDITP